jgi:hypothetical protein
MQTIVGRTATVAENATLATATSMPGTFPADKQAGDIVIAVYGFSCTPAQFTGPGAGWTLAVTPTDNGSAEIVAAYYQFDPPSVPTGTQSSGVATRCTLIVHGYGGVDPNNPIDVAAAITTALGASLVANGVTTVTPGAKVVSGYMYDTSSRTVTIPAGMNLVAFSLSSRLPQILLRVRTRSLPLLVLPQRQRLAQVPTLPPLLLSASLSQRRQLPSTQLLTLHSLQLILQQLPMRSQHQLVLQPLPRRALALIMATLAFLSMSQKQGQQSMSSPRSSSRQPSLRRVQRLTLPASPSRFPPRVNLAPRSTLVQLPCRSRSQTRPPQRMPLLLRRQPPLPVKLQRLSTLRQSQLRPRSLRLRLRAMPLHLPLALQLSQIRLQVLRASLSAPSERPTQAQLRMLPLMVIAASPSLRPARRSTQRAWMLGLRRVTPTLELQPTRQPFLPASSSVIVLPPTTRTPSRLSSHRPRTRRLQQMLYRSLLHRLLLKSDLPWKPFSRSTAQYLARQQQGRRPQARLRH